MAAICRETMSPTGCGHRIVTIDLDGHTHTLHLYDSPEPLDAIETQQFLELAARRLRAKGVSVADWLHRVLVGEEATNVKQYTLFGPGLAITKTNIGTAWVNVLPDANGGRSLVEFTGCTEFRLVANVNIPATGTTGQLGMRVVRDSDENAKLYENAAIPTSPTGERELDTDWLPIPNGVNALELVRVQAKSTVASDDPVFRRAVLVVR